MKTKFTLFIIILIGVVVGLGYLLNKPTVSKYDGLAQCIKDSGAKFYGAFWCPHCQAQKKLFGGAAKYLPYIECSTPGHEQTQECKDKKIEGYPTWELADGTRLPLEDSAGISLATLAQKTQCLLPL